MCWYILFLQGFSDILEPFCNGPKTEVALINAVQVYCYEDTRIIKAFPQILKVRMLLLCTVVPSDFCGRPLDWSCDLQVLYNKDCISDQAIIYWHQKGSKTQGRQHFLNASQPLVKVYITLSDVTSWSCYWMCFVFFVIVLARTRQWRWRGRRVNTEFVFTRIVFSMDTLVVGLSCYLLWWNVQCTSVTVIYTTGYRHRYKDRVLHKSTFFDSHFLL